MFLEEACEHVLFGLLGALELGGDASVVHDIEQVREREHLRQFGLDDDHRSTSFHQPFHEFVNLELCADVDADARFVEQEDG